jgi:dTDP-4-amino-4,6-dideoxygalactose transaminase
MRSNLDMTPNGQVSRRTFLASTSAVVVAANGSTASKPALLGGAPVKTDKFPSWPVWSGVDQSELDQTLNSGKWGRGVGQRVTRFEEQFAKTMGARYCLATSSGTTALFSAINAMGIGPGDEVIVPPYTFIATINVVLMCHALPVFVDTDPKTLQIDATKIEAVITERTAAIIPVHLGGGTFDVDAVQAIAQKHNLQILEDSCQSHLSEWRGKRTGNFGRAGCFSFQASKNLNAGEGGAVLSADEDFIQRSYGWHNNGRAKNQPGEDFAYRGRGLNMRMTEFQGSVLTTQMVRIEANAKKREENAKYLTRLLDQSPGLTPVSTYQGCTRNAYHLFMMRYDSQQFAGLPRARFLQAMAAEGVPALSGYEPLNQQPFLRSAFESKHFQAIYSKERINRWFAENQTPANDQVCQDAVWFTQNMLLGTKTEIEQIAEAVRKIQRNAGDLRKA